MASAPVSIRLRCASWKQLAAIFQRDLTRGALFLKTSKPPPVGTPMRISLTLPSDSMIILAGAVQKHVGPGGMDGRGPGVDVRLEAIPQTAMWMIESALTAAQREGSVSQPKAGAAAEQARRRAASPVTEPPTSTAALDPDMGAGDDLVEAEDQLIAALRQEYQALQRLNAFQILGVGYETSDDEVRASFGELTKRYHPDRFARYQSAMARELASEIFILIRDAYRKLGTPDGRARVIDVIRNRRPVDPRPTRPGRKQGPERTTRPETPVPAPKTRGPERFADEPPPTPAQHWQRSQPIAVQRPSPAPLPAAGGDKAAALIEAGRYEDALALYTAQARRDPDDREARAGIELAAGLRALAQRDRLEAAQRFEVVLEIDPTNERAARELAEMRRQATNERKGLLTRLLGKDT